MRVAGILILLLIGMELFGARSDAGEIFRRYRNAVCLVHYYQNIASNSKIGSFNKIERFHNGIIVNDSGLVMVSSDVYPVGMDIVSGNGSFLTGLPSDFRVTLANGKEFPAEFVGKDDQAQVAFIRIQADTTFPFVRFHPGKELQVGDRIYILERLPRRYHFRPVFTPTRIHAVVDFPRRKYLVNGYSNILSACGLVLDSQGDAIGVTLSSEPDFSFRTPEEFEQFRISFLEIAPAEWFQKLIQHPPHLEKQLPSQKSWLGIRMQGLTPALREYWHVPQDGGVVINRVYPQSPAEKAGLQEGDIILKVNGEPLPVQKDEDTARLREIIRSMPPGTTVQLTIFRNGKIIRKSLTLEQAPVAIGVAERLPVPEVGFELRELTRDILHQENLPLDFPGVYVYQVDRASPAGIAGIQIGDIIQKIDGVAVPDIRSARKFFEEFSKKAQKKMMVQVLRDRETRFLFIDLTK